MKEKRTGILTLSSAQNYGAVLQSFSLMQFLQENYGQTEIIDYTPQFIIGRYNLINIDRSSIYNRVISTIKGIIKLPIPLLTRIRFYNFRKKYCSYSVKKYVSTINEDIYDQYIVGSDQVFNLTLTGNEKTFFLPFVNDSTKKATYAASLGLDNVTQEQCDIYRKGLKDFSHISVREINGANIVRELLPGKTVNSNIDPVFLHGMDFWKEIAYDYKKNKEKYVLIYTLSNKAIHKSLKIIKERFSGYKTVYITDSISKPGPHVINRRGVGPRQFLGLIRDAEYVITNSFHGSAFSIIFEKQFYVIPFEKTSTRMVNLLNLLGLEKRLVLSDISLDEKEIDYKPVREKIKIEVARTRNYFNAIYSD